MEVCRERSAGGPGAVVGCLGFDVVTAQYVGGTSRPPLQQLAGGKDNFAADRESGDMIAAAFPQIRTAVLENRAFLRRAVTFLAEEVGVADAGGDPAFRPSRG
jgi:hypothetical protein